jgi:competence protein ComEC
MSLLMTWGYTLGRRVPLLDPLGAAAMLILMWRPHELVSPGFQLSFGVVAGLLCFTATAARAMRAETILRGSRRTLGQRILGWLATYLAANVTAFFIALPLVMYHFHNVSPMTVLLSIITLPGVTAVLALGYVKMAVGLFLPGLGRDMAGPLWWLTHELIALVDWASHWPGVYLEMARGPSAGWTAAALLMIVAVLAGAFRRRFWALGASSLLLGIWLTVLLWGYRTQPSTWPGELGPDVKLRVNYLAVGDGNCYLLRFARENQRPYVLMYDCGSHDIDGGLEVIIPALQELGVRQIDTLIISHADKDHYNGTLDVARHISVGRVIVSNQMMRRAARPDARYAPAYLLSRLRQAGVPVQSAGRGWRDTQGSASLELLWPDADFTTPPENDNDLSIVLAVRTAGRRLLFNGDIAALGMAGVIARRTDLHADVSDMPHHGSFIRGNSLPWMKKIHPQWAIQSCGMDRVEKDPWKTVLPRNIQRLRTAVNGMIELDIHADGSLSWRHFVNHPEKQGASVRP